ncbi:unnamed protein product, partial [Prorocentrum cordatum]
RPAAQHGRAAVAALHGALLRRQARRGPAQSLSQRLHVQLRERGHLRAPSAALRPIDRGDLVVLYGLRHAVRRQEGDHDDHQHERRGCSCPRWSRAVAGDSRYCYVFCYHDGSVIADDVYSLVLDAAGVDAPARVGGHQGSAREGAGAHIRPHARPPG